MRLIRATGACGVGWGGGGADERDRSACPKDEPGYASQQTVYENLGKDLLDHSFEGFNTCIIACE